MDYKVTFDDNSEALLHYGVKGMKWGKWNAETQARYAGAGNGTYFKKATHGNEYGRSVTDLRRAYNANQPKSKQIAKQLLFGPGGAHGYNTARSRGLSRLDAAQAGVLLGPLYAQGVKHKQAKLGTTKPQVSKAAKERSEYGRNESIPKSGIKYALAGPAPFMAYNSVKTRTKSRGKAALAAIGVTAVQETVSLATGTPQLGFAAGAGVSALGTRKGDYKKQTDALAFEKRVPERKRNGKQRW